MPVRPRLRFGCDCVYDPVDGHTYCDRHRVLGAQREGSSTRTGDELTEVFLEDAAGLLYDGLPVMDPAWATALDQAAEDHAVNGAWLGNEDLREELDDLREQAEERLAAEGWLVEWDDGYVIFRPTDRNPVRTIEEALA